MAGIDNVGALARKDVVVTLTAINGVIAGQAGDAIGAVIAGEYVGRIVANDGVVCCTTKHHLEVVDAVAAAEGTRRVRPLGRSSSNRSGIHINVSGRVDILKLDLTGRGVDRPISVNIKTEGSS